MKQVGAATLLVLGLASLLGAADPAIEQKATRWIHAAYKVKCASQGDAFAAAVADDEGSEHPYACGSSMRLNFKLRQADHGPSVWNLTFQIEPTRRRPKPSTAAFAQHLPVWLKDTGTACDHGTTSNGQTSYTCVNRKGRTQESMTLKQEADAAGTAKLEAFFYKID